MSHENFVGRINAPTEWPPARAYIHKTGFKDAYQGNIELAKGYFLQVLDKYAKDFQGVDFLLAILWGLDANKMSDVFGLSDIRGDKWHENATIHGWTFKNTDFIPQPTPEFERGSEKTCEESVIILADEMHHRRLQEHLAQYAANPPTLILSIPEYTVKGR